MSRAMAAVAPFSVLVNSSDGFEDCWAPFFTLFDRHWPDCNVPIFLNTEEKRWSFAGLDLRSTQVRLQQPHPRRQTWSECLLAALRQIESPIVLYLQEDYFIERPVDVQLIEEMVALMIDDPAIKHIGLTDFGSGGPFTPTADKRLWQISQNARYRISTQAGLWRRETLASYVRSWENGWMFELFGTRRARRNRELFLTLNRDLYNARLTPAVHYVHTGIIKGQWHRGVQDLFRQHGILVDFSRRGFYEPPAALLRRLDLLRRIVAHPINAARSMFG